MYGGVYVNKFNYVLTRISKWRAIPEVECIYHDIEDNEHNATSASHHQDERQRPEQ